MKPHSQFFHIQWERQSFQLKRHSHPQCRAPGTSSLGTHGSLLMSSWMSIWPWGLQTKLCQNVHMPQEKDSALFWPSAFGTVIYSFCLFVSRNAVHLGPSLGCGTKQAFKSKWGMHKLFFFFFLELHTEGTWLGNLGNQKVNHRHCWPQGFNGGICVLP